jgi:uncharacterized membrane protein
MNSWLEVTGLTFFWTVLIVRAPFVWPYRLQRILWTAMALEASATTLYQPAIVKAMGDAFGSANIVDLVRHSFSTVSLVVIVVLFLTAAGLTKWRQRFLTLVACTVGAAIIILAASEPHSRVFPLAPGVPLAYWLILFGFRLFCDLSLVAVTPLLMKRAALPETRWTIALFGIARLFASSLWAILLTTTITGNPRPMSLLAPTTAIHQIFMSASVGLAGGMAIATYLRNSYRRRLLKPLWQAATTEIPNVVLDMHPARKQVERYWPSNNALEWSLYRMIIEIHDAAIELSSYSTDFIHDQARSYIAHQDLPDEMREPAITACRIAAMCAAHIQGAAPNPTDEPTRVTDSTSLHEDLTYLTAVAQAYTSPLVSSFLSSLTIDTINSDTAITPGQQR